MVGLIKMLLMLSMIYYGLSHVPEMVRGVGKIGSHIVEAVPSISGAVGLPTSILSGLGGRQQNVFSQTAISAPKNVLR
jgi:hypothetical protein